MSVWIFPIRVAGEKKDYYYDLDRALEKISKRTIYQSQGRIRSIDVGDIVYFYEGVPVSAIGWKCRVLAVKVPPQKVDIDESEFEHGKTERDDYYIKVTAIAKYEGDARRNLSRAELEKHGFTQVRSPHRATAQLLKYINSIAPSVVYDD